MVSMESMVPGHRGHHNFWPTWIMGNSTGTTTSRHFHPNSKGSLSKTPKKPYETMLTAEIHEFYQWLSSDFREVSPYFPMESIGFHWFPWYENGNANRDAANQGHSLLHRLPKDPDLLRRRVGPRLVDLPSGKHTKKLWKDPTIL